MRKLYSLGTCPSGDPYHSTLWSPQPESRRARSLALPFPRLATLFIRSDSNAKDRSEEASQRRRSRSSLISRAHTKVQVTPRIMRARVNWERARTQSNPSCPPRTNLGQAQSGKTDAFMRDGIVKHKEMLSLNSNHKKAAMRQR